MAKDKIPGTDTSKIARGTLAKLSEEERKEVRRIVTKALNDRDLPKFKAEIAKLGYAETSAEYERLMQLWDEHWSASRHD